MARDLTPIVKRSRREGVALHPKAHKIMVRRKNAPGMHGGSRRSKPSQYSLQLREKQKLKRMFGLLEKQFVRLVNEAERSDGVSGEVLMQLLERRLDNVIYRSQLASSRRAARQLVTHGHFMLNGRRVDVPSMRVKAGDEITLRQKSLDNTYFKEKIQELKDADLTAHSWLAVDHSKGAIKVTGAPLVDEFEPEVSVQLIIEFYSR